MVMFHSIWTLLLLIAFIGIVAWAWSGRRRQDFERAARIPLEDDRTASGAAGNHRGARDA